MIIITAKLVRAIARACARPLATPLALGALLLAPAARADWKLTPTLDLRETYSDNVLLQSDARARGSFITEVSPGIRVRHKGPRLVFNGLTQLHYYALSNSDVPGGNRSNLVLHGDGKAKLIEDLLYLDGGASIQQQGISAFGPIFNNGYSDVNKAKVRTYRISPYLVHNFGRSANTELRYTRDSVDAGTSGLGNTEGDTLAFRLNSGPNFNTVGWGLMLSDQTIRDEIRNDSHIKLANLNLRYRLGRTFSLTAAIGYDDYDYEALGGTNSGKSWSTGFVWNPSLRTSLQASFGHRYYGPSRSLTAVHRSRRTVWSINFNDMVSTTRGNFIERSMIDTVTLVDALFLPLYPDPVERQRAVDAYILSTGLPPTLGNNVNYFSNRYVLQKELRAAMMFRGARSSSAVSLFRVRRDALSVRNSDSSLLGSSVDTLNDDVIQTGVNTTLTYRLAPRTSLNLIGDVVDSESITTGFETRSHSLRLTARHQLKAKLVASLELRHTKGNSSLQFASPYTENAVSAKLSMQL